MSTQRQIEANRRNSQKSTGPTSVAGRAASSMNALKTGIHAKSMIIPGEKLADLELLIAEHYRDHRPTTAKARLLVDEIIRCEWTLRRLASAETQMWQFQNEHQFSDPETFPLGYSATSKSATFSKLQYRLDSTRRALHRAFQALDQLPSEPVPAREPDDVLSPQIGFVPSPPIPARSQPPAPLQSPHPAAGHRPSHAQSGRSLCHPEV